MFLAISLCQTDDESCEGVLTGKQIVYTSKCAAFEYENTALEFAGNHDFIMIINTNTGDILKDASVLVAFD